MDFTTINRLAGLMRKSWNDKSYKKEVKKSINSLLNKKKTSNVIKEYKDFVDTIPKENKKQVPIMTVILVLALCRRNLDEEKIIHESLKENGLLPALYGGLVILFSGTSRQLSINIEWQDDFFKNKYEFIRRFQGEFLYWDYIEVFIAVNIIGMGSKDKIEALAIKDSTRLLLLNMSSRRLNISASDNLISILLNKQNELDQNIGFFLLVSNLNHYLYIRENDLRAEELGIKILKSKKIENNKMIIHELNRISDILCHCSVEVRVALLLNYILSEKRMIPKVFISWLLEPELHNELIKEIKYSDKIKTLDEVYHLTHIISSTRRRLNSKEYPKLELYDGIAHVIVCFIKERKGIYQWAEKEKKAMEGICKLLPKKSKKRLLSFLEKESKNIMALGLDELVRFDIFLKDKSKQEIIFGMISIIRAGGHG